MKPNGAKGVTWKGNVCELISDGCIKVVARYSMLRLVVPQECVGVYSVGRFRFVSDGNRPKSSGNM